MQHNEVTQKKLVVLVKRLRDLGASLKPDLAELIKFNEISVSSFSFDDESITGTVASFEDLSVEYACYASPENRNCHCVHHTVTKKICKHLCVLLFRGLAECPELVEEILGGWEKRILKN